MRLPAQHSTVVGVDTASHALAIDASGPAGGAAAPLGCACGHGLDATEAITRTRR